MIYFDIILGHFGIISGSFRDHFQDHFGVNLGLWGKFGWFWAYPSRYQLDFWGHWWFTHPQQQGFVARGWLTMHSSICI